MPRPKRFKYTAKYNCTDTLNDRNYQTLKSQKNISLSLIERTLTDTTTLCQSGPRNNGNEEVLYIPLSSLIGASLSDCFVSYPCLCKDAVGVFISFSRLFFTRCHFLRAKCVVPSSEMNGI